MKLFGYGRQSTRHQRPETGNVLVIHIEATPDELRQMAAFLLAEALQVECAGAEYCHGHLLDHYSELTPGQNVIVALPRDDA